MDLAQRHADVINTRVYHDHFNKALYDIVTSSVNRGDKVYQLWALADELTALYFGEVACKEGCHYCCHIPVALTFLEAAAIGKRIGKMPLPVNLRANVHNDPFGMSHPCPFLKDSTCSIYEHRPLACRLQYSVAEDSTPCELGESGHELRYAPYLNNQMPFQMALLHIAQPRVKEFLADIREFFPRGRG